MKPIKIIGICLSIILQALGHSLMAQCKIFAKGVDFSQLDDYTYCGRVQAAQMYKNDSAELDLKLEARTKYRILIEAQEYLGEVDLQILDHSNDVISIPIEESEKKLWEIFTEEKKKLELRIKFKEKKSQKTLTNHIDAPGCVVLAVGKIKLEELVESSEVETDL